MNYDTSYLREKEWRLQKHQKFIKRFVNPKMKNFDSLFLFHNVGSGKTCNGVLAAEQYSVHIKNNNIKGYIYIIANKASQNEFKNTITTECGKIANNITFMDIGRYDHIKKENIDKELRKNFYKFYTFQKFGHNSILKRIHNFDNSLIIVDEAHTLLNENKFYKNFISIIYRSKNTKLMLMTATPIINNPENLVNFINIMQKKNDLAHMSEFFHKNGALKKEWMIGVIKYFKNRVSYVQTYDEKYFPKINHIGKTLSANSQIKVIQCVMEKNQYKTYMDKYKGNITTQIRNIMDFTFFDDKYIPYYFNITENVRGKPSEWFVKNKVNIRENILCGDFMKFKNLKKYSTKYWRCLKEIINNPNGHGFIFSRYVHNSGIRFFGEILKWNGFLEYGKSANGKTTRDYLTNKYKENSLDFIPATFFILYGDISYEDRNNIISIFNSKKNKDGQIIKYILGSNLLKESVNFKRINHVHILGYQDNFSRLNQIIGRAIRFKSHKDVEPFVNIYKYVVSSPQKHERSAEENEYVENEKKYKIIKKIERGIKMISLDCSLNYKIFDKKYNNTEICDYMRCKYNCLFKDYDFDKNDLAYDIFYSHYDMFDIFNHITKLFANNVIISIDYILLHFNQYKPKYILSVLNEMTRLKLPLIDKKNQRGFLITDGANIYFHPEKYDYMQNKIDGISLNARKNPYIRGHKYKISTFLSSPKIRKKKPIKIIINKDTLHKIDEYQIDKKIKILEKVLMDNRHPDRRNNRHPDRRNNRHPDRKGNTKIKYEILKYFKYFLIDKDVVKDGIMYNRNFDGKIKNRIFIGHVLDIMPKIIKGKKFIFTNNNLLYNKILKENDFIVGYAQKDGIKLKYVSHFLDKRKQSKGFICHQSNDKKELLRIYTILMQKCKKTKKIDKKNIQNICVEINNTLRELQFNDKTIRWFYDF